MIDLSKCIFNHDYEEKLVEIEYAKSFDHQTKMASEYKRCEWRNVCKNCGHKQQKRKD